MCGIVGWLRQESSNSEQEQVVRAMMAAIQHRGPDDCGSFICNDGRVTLGHRRLSIIDLSDASHQPMVDAASGVVLVFNGEIYNFRALRKELEALGYPCHTAGDTEVLLNAYLAWGAQCVHKLAGMFAFAVWDPRSGVLHLVRDAMGIKPLFLAALPDGIAFASEVKAFRALPGFRAALDSHGVHQFLEFGYIFDGAGTGLQGVEKVLPGQWVTLRDGRIVTRTQWYQPPLNHGDVPGVEGGGGLDPVAGVDGLATLLQQVVDEHLIADVPIGLLLSGGLDSSVVAAMAAKRGPLTTICMAFSDSTVDEREHARRVARHIGSNHIEVVISPEEIKQEVQAGAWVFDDLFADWGTVSTRLLYRRCRQLGIKAVLVGEGSDELFGGYDVFECSTRGPLGLFRLYQRYAGRRWGALYAPFRRMMRDYLVECDGDDFAAIRLFESRRQLPNQYVMKVDKASMAESVEARTPFLDRRIADFAYRTPRAALLAKGENKHLLREVARRQNLVPPEIVARKKFGAPLAADWMDTDAEFRAFARSKILANGNLTDSLGLRPAMRDYFDRGQSGQRWPGPLSIYRNLAWRLLLLEMWGAHYLQGAAP